jgi:hypothetical protein
LLSREIRLFITGEKPETFTTTREELIAQLRKKYVTVQDYGDETTKFLFSLGQDGFIKDVYTMIYLQNEIVNRVSMQNLCKAMVANIRRHLIDPRKQIEYVKAEKPRDGLKKIKEAIFENDCKMVDAAIDINDETAKKFGDRKDGLTELEEYQLRKHKIKKFYKIDTIDYKFISTWGHGSKIVQLSMFSMMYLWSDEVFNQKDDVEIKTHRGDSLIHIDFKSDMKLLFSDLLEVFNFKIEDAMIFEFFLKRTSTYNLSKLNEILPKFMIRDRKHKLPTKLPSHQAIPSMLRTLMYLTGIPTKTKNDVMKVDIDEIYANMERLIIIYQGDVDVLERIVQLQDKVIEERRRL